MKKKQNETLKNRLIGGIVGAVLAGVTLSVLGPFSALVAGFSAGAIAGVLEKRSRKRETERKTYENAVTEKNYRGITTDYLNIKHSLPSLPIMFNQNNREDNSNLINLNNILTNHYFNMTQMQRNRGLNSQNERHTRKRTRRRNQIRVDEYGRIFDPDDE